MMTQILLIDDDPIINFVHSKLIRKKFPETPFLIFENGFNALEYINENSDIFYLIFLDLNMPKMDGWEFLEAISLLKHKVTFQIHLVTSSLDPEDRKKAEKDEDVGSFLVKPLKDGDLSKITLDSDESV